MAPRFRGICKDCGGKTSAATKMPLRCRKCSDAAWEERFWAKVNKRAGFGCWEWTGARQTTGYGNFCTAGVTWRAHRLSYTLIVGEIPPGLQLDHLCRNRWCVNPMHLEPVTCGENLRRGYEARAAA